MFLRLVVLGVWLECYEWIELKIKRLVEVERELEIGTDQRVLRWFGHALRLDEHRTARRVLMAKVSGGRVRGRLMLGWCNGGLGQ